MPLETRLDRREFLRATMALSTGALAGAWLLASGCAESRGAPLSPPDANGIRLPAGFRSRVLARSGDPVAETGFV